MITRKQLIEKYLKFFQSKSHKIIPSASLIPANDPTVLFTTAGMHPLVPYLLGQKHLQGKRLCSVQRCIRTTDIDSVGDSSHNTFFEMLGNWSLGDYWKKEAIEMSFEFLTKELRIPKEKLAVTIFAGDKTASADIESKKIWEELKIPKGKIIPLKEDNWWGPAGNTGPCGPDTEMFYWNNKSRDVPEEFNPNDSTLATDGNDWIEIWNDVFMQYNKTPEGKFLPLKQRNVDTGMGVERTLAILNGLDDIYETEVFLPIIKKIEEISGKKYIGNEKAMRIIADHIKASIFIIADGVVPSNTGQGYILRRLIRRVVRYGDFLGLKKFIIKIASPVFKIYSDYKKLEQNKEFILNELEKEENKFLKTLESGEKALINLIKDIKPSAFGIPRKDKKTKEISGKDAFLLYQSYGFPIELTEEIANEKGIKVNIKEFEKELSKHQELSRTASQGLFKSGLADHSEKTIRLHTATHLLNQALRGILGPEVKQRGSNITPERLRFDFNFPRKLTDSEIAEVESLVNKKISEAMPVEREEMSLKKALSIGAQAEFGMKYPEVVSVYFIGGFSKEICTGPHVKNTKEIGKFKITKEESSAAGIRRIKAIIEY